MAKRVICDPWLLFVTALLVGAGLFMVGSASNYVALEFGKSPSAYGWRHLLHLMFGVGALLAALSVPYQRLAEQWVVRSALAISFFTLVFVLTMPEICDARRWIPLGVFNFQPSEFAKLTTVLYLAWVLSHKQEQINDLWSVPLPSMMIVGSMAFLVVIEPDLGSAVIPIMVAGLMIVVAGLRWRYAFSFLGVGAVGFAIAVVVEPYRIARMLTFLNPWADSLGRGYQLCQSQIAFGNGGLTGMGMGGGGQRALFLPAPHTDFIWACSFLRRVSSASFFLASDASSSEVSRNCVAQSR